MFRNLSISKKLGAAMLAAALVLSGVIVYLLAGLWTANRNLNELVDGPFEQNALVSQSRLCVLQLARDIRDMYIRTGAAAEGRAALTEAAGDYGLILKRDQKALETSLNQLEASFTQIPPIAAAYRQQVADWVAVGDEIVASIVAGDRDRAARLILNDCPRALDAVSQTAAEIQEQTAADNARAVAASLRNVQITILVSCLDFAAAGMVSVILFLRARASILKPLREIQKYAGEMAQGHLQSTVTYRSQDEFGTLADSLRESGETLSGYITDFTLTMRELSHGNFDLPASMEYRGDFAQIQLAIGGFVTNMSEVLGKMGDFAEQVSHGMEEVAGGAQNVAQGSTEQAGAIQEIAANIGDTSSKIIANAASSARASDSAAQAGEKITACAAKMDAMLRSIAEIEQATGQIGRIIGIIQEISLQTNLLALNAAVEAAHAGTFGKGFAVVASEVRDLAVKSSEASRDTAAYIERSVQAVKQGADLARDTAEALSATVDRVRETAGMLDEISQTSAGQARLLSQVTVGIDQISQVVQNNSATAEEEAAASGEMSRLAHILRETAGRFRIRKI